MTPLKGPNLKQVVAAIKKANKILLTTHREADGDGLGAELALFHALKKINKEGERKREEECRMEIWSRMRRNR